MNFGDFEMKSYQELKDTPALSGVDHRRGAQRLPQRRKRAPGAGAEPGRHGSGAGVGEDAVCVVHGGVTAGLMMTWFGGGRSTTP
ncbi:MAG: hypothetical protein ACLUNQ_05745 [Oscillospiraceae bacterium]